MLHRISAEQHRATKYIHGRSQSPFRTEPHIFHTEFKGQNRELTQIINRVNSSFWGAFMPLSFAS
jgi:hypothetical protein